MRRQLVQRFVIVVSALVLLLCIGWALLVERVVHDACTYSVPPPNAQYLHCP